MNLKNFAYSTVATAPSPASSGTSLVLASGGGALMPSTPFWGVDWPTGVLPTAANAEIVQVTNIATDTLTIVRAQESTPARTVVVGDQFAAAITRQTLLDLLAEATAYTDSVFSAAEQLANKDAANGYPSLDSGSLVPAAELTGVLALSDLTDGPSTGTFTPADNSGASLTITINDANYLALGPLTWISFNIAYPVTADGTPAELKVEDLPNGTHGANLAVGYSTHAGGLTAQISWDGLKFIIDFFSLAGVQLTNVQLSAVIIQASGVIY
jgi:hypothetical protein